MIQQDNGLLIPNSLNNILALLLIQDNASIILIHRVILIKPQAILSQHLQFPTKTSKRLAMNTVCVTRSVDFWSRFVDSGVDSESCCIDGFVAFDDKSVFVNEYQVRDFDEGKVH